MKILALWVSDYFSGTASERFRKPFLKLGHELRVVPLQLPGAEGKLLKEVEEWKPDFLFHEPYADSIRPEIIKYISFKTPTVTISWNGDDEWLFASDPNHKNRIQAYNYCVTTDKMALPKYAEIGYDRVILGQWGYAAETWKPSKAKKDIEVYFCGAKTPERDLYLRDLRDSGIPIKFEGPGYTKEKVPLEKMVKNYQRAKIGLNFTLGVKKDHVYTQVKARNFEIPATGTFQLSEACPNLGRFFKYGEEVETFKGSEELIKKIKFYLKNDGEREKVGAAGRARARAYSYEKILAPIFKATKARAIK